MCALDIFSRLPSGAMSVHRGQCRKGSEECIFHDTAVHCNDGDSFTLDSSVMQAPTYPA